MTRLYIIRHAEAEGNLYRRIHGWYNSHITDNGMRQIAALEHRFQDIRIDAAYASDLIRTQTTAQAIVRPKGLELHTDPDLREIGMGVYEERTFGDVAYHEPDKMRLFGVRSPDWNPPGGETFQQVCDRITRAVFRIAAAHPGQTVAIFSHGAAIRCLQSALRGKHPCDTPELGNCENTAVTCLDIEDGRASIVFENDASHLPAEIATQARQKLAAQTAGPALMTWFRPMDMETESRVYYEARKDAWQDIHGSLVNFDGPGFLAEAWEQWEQDHRAVECVMAGGEIIGVLQLAIQRDAGEGVGYVPFVYLRPEYRRRGIGVELIGQAVGIYRPLGRKCLHLRCAPGNDLAQRFYKRYGFTRIGAAPGSRVPLDLLEKPI